MANFRKGFFKKLPYFGITIRALVTDGRDVVHAKRNEMDIINGKRMDPERCVDANCFMRHGKDGTFPHPVLAAWVIKSMVYILRSANADSGKYVVVRYRHHNWKYIRDFDKTGKWTGPTAVGLYPPGKANHIGADTRRGRNSGGRHKKPTGRVAAPKGINARFITVKQWQEGMALSGRAA